MKIIIAGAGAVGFHLAELMSRENQDITLIDLDEEVLAYASSHLDLLTIKGDVSSTKILEQAKVSASQLFIAVTTSEKTNILSAILAKEFGAKKTVARIQNSEYLEVPQKERFKKLGVDVLISPTQLAAQEMLRLLERASFTDLFEFENGKLSIVGFTLDATSPLINQSITQIDEMNENFSFKGIALLRGQKTIIPKGDTLLRQGDHLYIATPKENLDEVMIFGGKQLQPIKNVMIVGGTRLAIKTASILEDRYRVTIVITDKKQENQCLEILKNSLIVKANPGNINALKEEGLERMDAFIALTANSEINIITSLTAEQVGVYKTIALVDNINYIHIAQNIGIDTIVNQKLIAANNISIFIRKGKIEAIASLHGVDAEIIEFVIHKSNRLLKHPVRDLHFPEKSIVAGVIRGEKSYLPDEDFRFELEDKVIILALPEAIHKVEEIFR